MWDVVVKGGPLMVPIILCSVCHWQSFIERSCLFLPARGQSACDPFAVRWAFLSAGAHKAMQKPRRPDRIRMKVARPPGAGACRFLSQKAGVIGDFERRLTKERFPFSEKHGARLRSSLARCGKLHAGAGALGR
jgi:hypothetical protein